MNLFQHHILTKFSCCSLKFFSTQRRRKCKKIIVKFLWLKKSAYVIYELSLSALHILGLMIEFVTDNVACRSDGTRRISEPNTEENLTCVTVFILVYFTENVWSFYFVKLLFSIYLRTQGDLGKEKRMKLNKWLHVVSW